jgi:hypothetical protein
MWMRELATPYSIWQSVMDVAPMGTEMGLFKP